MSFNLIDDKSTLVEVMVLVKFLPQPIRYPQLGHVRNQVYANHDCVSLETGLYASSMPKKMDA